MYKKVLLPLDGSKLAECVFTHVRDLVAGGLIQEITLLNVVEIPSAWIAEGIDFLAVMQAQVNKAQKYLTDVQSKLIFENVKVHSEVLRGETAHSIAEYAGENRFNLIIIATHGYTGMKRLMFGSVALRVLHDAHVPVLLVRPENAKK